MRKSSRKRKQVQQKQGFIDEYEDSEEEKIIEIKKNKIKELERKISDVTPIHRMEKVDETIPRGAIAAFFSYLTTEELVKCSMVSKSWFQMAKNKRLWRHIVLEDHPNMTDSNLKFFASEYLENKNFVSLRMNKCTDITDLGFRHLVKVSSGLTELHLTYCGAELTGASLGEVLNQCGENLEKLTLELSFSLFKGLTKPMDPKKFQFKKLSYLKLACVSNSSRIIKPFVEKYGASKTLKTLIINDTKYFSDLPNIISECKQLTHFECSPEYSDQKELQQFYISGVSLDCLFMHVNPENFTTFKICAYLNSIQTGFLKNLKSFPNLLHFECSGLTSDLVKYFNPDNLLSLTISYSYHHTVFPSKAFPKLKRFTSRANSDSSTINSIISGSHQTLEEIYVAFPNYYYNVNFFDGSMEEIDKCLNLKKFSLIGIPNLCTNVIAKLCPSIEELHLEPFFYEGTSTLEEFLLALNKVPSITSLSLKFVNLPIGSLIPKIKLALPFLSKLSLQFVNCASTFSLVPFLSLFDDCKRLFSFSLSADFEDELAVREKVRNLGFLRSSFHYISFD